MLKFVICDDEQKHNSYMKKSIEKIIAAHKLDAQITLITSVPEDVLKYSRLHREEKGNVYILDIDFEEKLNGIAMAKTIRENDIGAYIIFVSAHQEYSLLCYKLKTFDFLLKPVSYKILERCILSLVKDFNYMENIKEKIITIKAGHDIYRMNIDDIYYFEKYGKTLIIHAKKGVFRSHETLENIQKNLSMYGFFRCHKSYLINLRYVNHISVKENVIYMANDEKCPVSRNYKKELLRCVYDNL